MTFGSLMNWGSYGKSPVPPPIERYHSGPGSYWHQKSHGHRGHKSGGKGGGSSAALSALTLLAFLFLINVMQQSLQENNSTLPSTSGTAAVLLREGQQQVPLSNGAETNRRVTKKLRESNEDDSPVVKSKGDDFDEKFEEDT